MVEISLEHLVHHLYCVYYELNCVTFLLPFFHAFVSRNLQTSGTEINNETFLLAVLISPSISAAMNSCKTMQHI